MLSLVGLVCKQYWERLGGGEVPEVVCPDPQCQGTRLRGHGWYSRYIAAVRQPVRRVRCPRCRVSHALLPEDLCAYRDASLGAVEAALAAGLPSAAARVAEQAGRRGVRRVRGWLRSGGAPWTEKLKALLPAAEGTWCRRVQEVVGEAAGWLLRLRRWLWSIWASFLGGVSGLYRHGRPERRAPPSSPEVGNCPPGGSAAKILPVLRDGP